MKKTKNVDEWHLHSVSSKASQSPEKSVDLQTTAQRTVNPKDCLSKPHKRMELSPGILLSRHSFYWGSHYFWREPNSLKHQLRTIWNSPTKKTNGFCLIRTWPDIHILLLSEGRQSNRLFIISHCSLVAFWGLAAVSTHHC